MLLIPTYVARSGIHGFGLFAAAGVRRDTVVWRFDPGVDWVISPDTVERLPAEFKPRFMRYAYQRPDGHYVLCCDNTLLMNHSPAPNLIEMGDYSVAARDIRKGEELTGDYRRFDQLSIQSTAAWLGGR
jgi:SET domain-containing protein